MDKQELKNLKIEGYLQQQDKEYFSLRIVTKAGNLDSDQVRCLADLADKYGRGYMGFTTRQSIEIPWIKEEFIPKVRQRIKEAGILTGGTGLKVVAIAACKGALCTYGLMDSQALSNKLHERFFGIDLAGKFKIGVAACPNNCVKAPLSDLGFMAKVTPKVEDDMCKGCRLCERTCMDHAIQIVGKKAIINYERCISCGQCIKVCPFKAMDTKKEGIAVYLGGKFGRTFRLGDRINKMFSLEEAVDITEKVIDYFKVNANKGERFGNTIDRVGIAKVKEDIFGNTEEYE